MVVDEDQAGRVLADGLAEELGRPDQGAADVAFVDLADGENLVTGAHEQDAQVLLVEEAHLAADQAHDVGRRADDGPLLRLEGAETKGEEESRAQLRGGAEALDRREVAEGEAGEATEAAVPRQQRSRQVEDALLRRAGAEDDDQELGGRKGVVRAAASSVPHGRSGVGYGEHRTS